MKTNKYLILFMIWYGQLALSQEIVYMKGFYVNYNLEIIKSSDCFNTYEITYFIGDSVELNTLDTLFYSDVNIKSLFSFLNKKRKIYIDQESSWCIKKLSSTNYKFNYDFTKYSTLKSKRNQIDKCEVLYYSKDGNFWESYRCIYDLNVFYGTYKFIKFKNFSNCPGTYKTYQNNEGIILFGIDKEDDFYLPIK